MVPTICTHVRHSDKTSKSRFHTNVSKLDEGAVESAAVAAVARFSVVQNSRNSSNSRMETEACVLVDSEES